MVFICISLISKDAEHFLKWLLVISISHFENIMFVWFHSQVFGFFFVLFLGFMFSCSASVFLVYSSYAVGFIAVKDFLLPILRSMSPVNWQIHLL